MQHSKRTFKLSYNEIGAKYEHLLQHTGVRWLSRGWVLCRLFELPEELPPFASRHKCDQKLYRKLRDKEWMVRRTQASSHLEIKSQLSLQASLFAGNILASRLGTFSTLVDINFYGHIGVGGRCRVGVAPNPTPFPPAFRRKLKFGQISWAGKQFKMVKNRNKA